MHLAGSREFSTFRLSLAAILASRRGGDAVDETSLTAWMKAHLVVVAEPVADADAVGRIEKVVLAAIDPPLNLQTTARTPVRRRLKELRGAVRRPGQSEARSMVRQPTGHLEARSSATTLAEEVTQVSQLLRSRNAVDGELAALIGRPMTSGHLGEWLAARIFPIELEASATAAGIDGRFVEGVLAGQTVNVKWYLKHDGLLDLTLPGPDLYLVLTGPRAATGSSRGQTRPWCVESVYLLDARELIDSQRRRGVKIGTASSIPGRDVGSGRGLPSADLCVAAARRSPARCASRPGTERRGSSTQQVGVRLTRPERRGDASRPLAAELPRADHARIAGSRPRAAADIHRRVDLDQKLAPSQPDQVACSGASPSGTLPRAQGQAREGRAAGRAGWTSKPTRAQPEGPVREPGAGPDGGPARRRCGCSEAGFVREWSVRVGRRCRVLRKVTTDTVPARGSVSGQR